VCLDEIMGSRYNIHIKIGRFFLATMYKDDTWSSREYLFVGYEGEGSYEERIRLF
jgi:hypothetical protein